MRRRAEVRGLLAISHCSGARQLASFPPRMFLASIYRRSGRRSDVPVSRGAGALSGPWPGRASLAARVAGELNRVLVAEVSRSGVPAPAGAVGLAGTFDPQVRVGV